MPFGALDPHAAATHGATFCFGVMADLHFFTTAATNSFHFPQFRILTPIRLQLPEMKIGLNSSRFEQGNQSLYLSGRS